MRAKSLKRQRQDRQHAEAKAEFLAAHPRCWECNGKREVQIHHMAKRSATANFEHPCNWFAACWLCNGGPLDHSDRAEKIRQLAIKSIRDSENHDRKAWLAIAGKALTWITDSDIYETVPTLAPWNQKRFEIPGGKT